MVTAVYRGTVRARDSAPAAQEYPSITPEVRATSQRLYAFAGINMPSTYVLWTYPVIDTFKNDGL